METSPEAEPPNRRTYATDGGTESRESEGSDDETLSPEIERDVDETELQEARKLLKGREGNLGFDSTSRTWIESRDDGDEKWDGSSVSRRGMIGYLSGTMLGIFGLAGAGWYAFIRETAEPEEKVVIDYWDYIDRAKYNSAVLLFHRNAPVDPPSAETVAVYSQASITVEDTEIVDSREDVKAAGVQEAAVVRAEISMDWGTGTDSMNPAFVVAQNEEDNWRMWDDGRHNDNEY